MCWPLDSATPSRPPNVPFLGRERYVSMFLCEKICACGHGLRINLSLFSYGNMLFLQTPLSLGWWKLAWGSPPRKKSESIAENYLFWGYLFVCWYTYSILRTIVPCAKHHLVNKLFEILVSTMVLSGFGPYCPLWLQHTQTKCIGVIPTPWAMTRALGLVLFPPQQE